MEKELVELFESVKKAADAAVADSSSEEARCVDALEQLKKFPVTYQVLVSTQVGKRLRQLTKHPRKKIQALASDVVEIWKNIIVQETTKNKKDGIIESEGSVKAESSSDSGQVKRVQRVNSIKVENSMKVEPADDSKKFQRVNSVKIEKVSTAGAAKVETTGCSSTLDAENAVKTKISMAQMEAERIDIVKTEKSTSDFRKPAPISGTPKLISLLYTKDQLRDKVRELLAEALCKVCKEVEPDLIEEVNACDPYRVAVSVETAMFEKWGRSNGAQKFKYRSIMFNIKDPNNPDFRRKVLLGQYPGNSILELTPEEMASDQRQKQNEKIKEKALFDCERAGAPKASTNQFKCGKCGKRETTYYQLQTRSADEPMTTFVTCVNCNNHWKFC